MTIPDLDGDIPLPRQRRIYSGSAGNGITGDIFCGGGAESVQQHLSWDYISHHRGSPTLQASGNSHIINGSSM